VRRRLVLAVLVPLFSIVGGGCDGDGGAGGPIGDLGAPPEAPADAATNPPVADMAAAQCQPGNAGRRFTIAFIPDTQYLFDGDRGDANVLSASVRWIVDHTCERNIVFTAGLGDIVQNADPAEFAAVDAVYKEFDDNGIQYSLPAGNHDLTNSGQDDNSRASNAPYLARFSAARVMGKPTFGGATANGYNSYFIFDGGGKKWLLFALDWRMSADSMQWVQEVIRQHSTLPVIFTMHELAYNTGNSNDPPDRNAALSDYGQTVWNTLVKNNDQVFLTVNGHYWTPARTTLQNDAGHDVHVHLANYQDRYYGGSGMIRLYEFDLDHNTVEVSTQSPYWAATPAAQRLPIQDREVSLDDPHDRFIEHIDFKRRFAGFDGTVVPPPPPPVPADQELIPGTLAYWRFDGSASGAVASSIADLSKKGNDLVRVTAAGGRDVDLVWTAEYHPYQPGHGALFFNGSKTTPPSYLRTVDGAPLNGLTLENGYTIEAFLRLPNGCCAGHAWMGALSRFGTGRDASKIGDDPLEPVATLSVTDGPGLQWADFPVNFDGIKTSWSHILAVEQWHHVAIVNDGHHSIMYVDGAPVLQNPKSESIGIATAGQYWMVGAYSYDHQIEQAFYGWLGDIRIVDHALAVDKFMTAR
jgi:hypothetical protein